jgi:hypothetical protein
MFLVKNNEDTLVILASLLKLGLAHYCVLRLTSYNDQ